MVERLQLDTKHGVGTSTYMHRCWLSRLSVVFRDAPIADTRSGFLVFSFLPFSYFVWFSSSFSPHLHLPCHCRCRCHGLTQFQGAVTVKTSDQLLVMYLGSLVRATIALHNVIDNQLVSVECTPVRQLNTMCSGIRVISDYCSIETNAPCVYLDLY